MLRNRSVCFGCFDIGSKHRNKPKYFVFGFTKQTETNTKQILFRFVSVRTEIYFCLFRGHSGGRVPGHIPGVLSIFGQHSQQFQGHIEGGGQRSRRTWRRQRLHTQSYRNENADHDKPLCYSKL